MKREFTLKPAVRDTVPLIVSLVGPSSSGKTFSALRLAAGMTQVTGGKIGVIDTEARRALHYADQFEFEHMAFGPPFSPDDYLAAIEYVRDQGCGTIVVDSASHEHEGPGGCLEWHERIIDQRVGENAGYRERQKHTFTAWIEPKQARTRLINTILQLEVNIILCFRAKEKLKVVPGGAPQPLGWMPIAGTEWMYEATVQALLLPGSGGVPTWQPDEPGSKQIVKLPSQFRELFRESRPLDEQHGKAMAEWAKGGAKPARPAPAHHQTAPAPSRPSADELKQAVREAADRCATTQKKVGEWMALHLKTKNVARASQLSDADFADLLARIQKLGGDDLE